MTELRTPSDQPGERAVTRPRLLIANRARKRKSKSAGAPPSPDYPPTGGVLFGFGKTPGTQRILAGEARLVRYSSHLDRVRRALDELFCS